MSNWITRLKETDARTKWFYFQWILYGSIIIGGAIYTYARIDFVRSGPKTEQVQTEYGNPQT